jgi:hypothetical protein
MTTIGERFPKEQARCREVLKAYHEIGPAGTFGAAMIEATLREADEAAVSGDLVRMIRAYEDMKKIES